MYREYVLPRLVLGVNTSSKGGNINSENTYHGHRSSLSLNNVVDLSIHQSQKSFSEQKV